MKKLIFILTLSLLLVNGLFALTAGDIAIIAMHTDTNKYVILVALEDIPANTTISFTDNAWNATTEAWRANEGTIAWSHTAIVTKGTVVTLSVNASPYSASTGSLTTNTNFNLSATGDQVLAYEGTTAPTTNNASTWLFGFSTENFVWENNSNTSDIPTALSGFSVAMTTSTTETDNAYFANGAVAATSVTVSGTKSELLALFTDSSKYYKDNSPITAPTYSVTVISGGGNTPTSISNIVQTPSTDITSSTTVSVSATITDSDGTVEAAGIYWGTTSGSLATYIDMSNTTGDTWVTDTPIPAQANGTTVYYEIYALDDDADETTSAEQSYTVTDPTPPAPDAPIATDATATTDNSFTANWDSVLDATGYRLDVYQGSSNSGTLAEGFEDTSTATPPTDWTLSTSGSYVQTTAANAHNGTNYAGMNATNGWVQTPQVSNPASCSFWARTSASSANFTAKVQSSPDGTNWTDQATYTATPTDAGDVTSTYTEKSIDLNLTGDYYLRWVITARSGGSFYFDDVSISSGSKTYVDGYENRDVGNVASYNVTGLDPETTYYYVVRAYKDYQTHIDSSVNSNEIEVTTTEDATLPVELSSFTVALNATNQAVLTWVTQTETGVNGFYIYRNNEGDLADALLISSLIPATNSSQQQVYIYRDKELNGAGTYYYWLQVSDLNGSESYHGPVTLVYEDGNDQQTPVIPKVTELKKIFPNPFNPSATISYGLVEAAPVSIKIYNSRGQMVRSFEEGLQNAGSYNLIWNGEDNSGRSLPTGVYYIRMQAGQQSFNKKAVLMK